MPSIYHFHIHWIIDFYWNSLWSSFNHLSLRTTVLIVRFKSPNTKMKTNAPLESPPAQIQMTLLALIISDRTHAFLKWSGMWFKSLLLTLTIPMTIESRLYIRTTNSVWIIKSLETEKYSLLGMRKIRYFQYTSNIYQNQAEYPVYIDLGSSDKTKQYYIVKSPDSKVKLIPLRNMLRNPWKWRHFNFIFRMNGKFSFKTLGFIQTIFLS